MGKIILFYKYTDIQYPKQIFKWQMQVCRELNLKGRVIIANEGINATLGGSEQNIEIYKKIMNNHIYFKDIDFKESEGNAECFPRLRIVIKNEIVKLGIDPREISYKQSGKHISPSNVHRLLSNKPSDLIVLDVRNNYESNIGNFEGAILPDIKYFRQLPEYIDSNLDLFKDKQVLMYCTGNIRCERASAYLKSKNIAREVYQLEGGIHRYIEQFPNGYFKGKNYVFDARISIAANESIIGNCFVCNEPYDDYTNCLNAVCNRHFICCKNCIQKLNNTCSQSCYDLTLQNKVKIRPQFKKFEKKECCS